MELPLLETVKQSRNKSISAHQRFF